MNIAPATNIGGIVAAHNAGVSQDAAGAPSIVTAGGALDGAAVTGPTIDRQDALSAVLAIAARATLGNTETLTFQVDIQDSADGTAWGAVTTVGAAAVLLDDAGAGGGDYEGEREVDLDLSAYRRYIRFQITPTMSAAGVDVANWAALCVLGGAAETPV